MTQQDVTFSPLICSCGKRRATLLKLELHDLISKHGLPEVLDRLADELDTQSQLPQNEATEQIWNSLVRSMEEATREALNLTAIRGEKVWS